MFIKYGFSIISSGWIFEKPNFFITSIPRYILAISYGIHAMHSMQAETHNSFLLSTLYYLERKRWLFKEDLVVVLGGSFGPEKGASFMEIGNVLNFQHKAIKKEVTCNQE